VSRAVSLTKIVTSLDNTAPRPPFLTAPLAIEPYGIAGLMCSHFSLPAALTEKGTIR
jgi:hypothetical protein